MAYDHEQHNVPGVQASWESKILSPRKQAEVVNSWLIERFDTVLPMVMKRAGVDMWIVACRENNEDPVFMTLVEATQNFARRLSIFAFYRTADGTVERYMVMKTRTDVGGALYRAYWKLENSSSWENLRELLREKNPAAIAINTDKECPYADGLTHALYEEMMATLAPEFGQRIVGGRDVAVGWLETRCESECIAYEGLLQIAHGVLAEAFSSRVVNPGISTGDDIAWWMYKKIASLGLKPMLPSIGIQRCGAKELTPNETVMLGGQLPSSTIVMPGDLLHCDYAFTYLRLCTDITQNAYILRSNESEPPAGLQKAVANTNKLQDIVLRELQTGRTGNDVLRTSRMYAEQAGLVECIYNHPIGFHIHAAGPAVGQFTQQEYVPSGDAVLHDNTAHTLELNARTMIPEWNNQTVMLSLEEIILMKDGKAKIFDGRQIKLHLIR